MQNIDMMRPTNLVYSVSETPPALTCFLNALQHIAINSGALIFPILIMRAGEVSDDLVMNVISLSLLATGIGTALQSLTLIPFGREQLAIGCGYLLPNIPAVVYLPASILALKAGGMPLVFGMTLFGGLIEILLAQLVRWLRSFFPNEISGLCVLLIGILLCVLGVRLIFGLGETTAQPAERTLVDIALGGGTLALMLGLNVLFKKQVRMYCGIIGIFLGSIIAIFIGAFDEHAKTTLLATQFIHAPSLSFSLPNFQFSLLLPFVISALVCCLKVMGDITTCQKINDRDWARPDMHSLRNGIVADGSATVISACLGCFAIQTSSASVGMSNATGVTSRRVGLWIAALLFALSFFPIVTAAFIAIPRPVIGAVIAFSGLFVMISGWQILTSGQLDARKNFVIGISLALALSREIFPAFYEGLPGLIQPIVSSSLCVGVTIALLLNAVFRLQEKIAQPYGVTK